jgi:Uma2 family endonuclease
MCAMSTATRMTAEEYFAISVEGDRTELIDGVMIVDEPRLEHVFVQGKVFTALTNWAESAAGRGLAFLPADVVVDEHNVFGPDVLWLREERVPDPPEGRLPGLPDLAVEVRSPSTWRYNLGKKKLAYERSGLPELWLVDNVAKTVLVFRRSNDKQADFDVALELAGADDLTSPLLPGFSAPAESLFRR